MRISIDDRSHHINQTDTDCCELKSRNQQKMISTLPSSKYQTTKQSPRTLSSSRESRKPFTMKTSPSKSIPILLTKYKSKSPGRNIVTYPILLQKINELIEMKPLSEKFESYFQKKLSSELVSALKYYGNKFEIILLNKIIKGQVHETHWIHQLKLK